MLGFPELIFCQFLAKFASPVFTDKTLRLSITINELILETSFQWINFQKTDLRMFEMFKYSNCSNEFYFCYFFSLLNAADGRKSLINQLFLFFTG